MNDFSVIIPTKNRHNDLIQTVATLLSCQPRPIEILIIDQTTEPIADWGDLQDPNSEIRYYHQPKINGILPARDFGVRKSKGRFLIFLDDDVSVYQDFMAKMQKTFEQDSRIDAVCAVNTSEEDMSVLRILARALFWLGPFWDDRSIVNKYYKRMKKPRLTTKFSAGYMSCKREVYERIGFDNGLTGHVFVGDIDFSYRASREFRLVISPWVRVVHRGGQSAHYDEKEAERKRIRGRIYFYQKNVDKTLLNHLFFTWLVLGTFLGALGRSFHSKSLAPVKGFFEGLTTRCTYL